jgi:hypothetical protein
MVLTAKLIRRKVIGASEKALPTNMVALLVLNAAQRRRLCVFGIVQPAGPPRDTGSKVQDDCARDSGAEQLARARAQDPWPFTSPVAENLPGRKAPTIPKRLAASGDGSCRYAAADF